MELEVSTLKTKQKQFRVCNEKFPNFSRVKLANSRQSEFPVSWEYKLLVQSVERRVHTLIVEHVFNSKDLCSLIVFGLRQDWTVSLPLTSYMKVTSPLGVISVCNYRQPNS